uniref:Uncharacterized protein n=1 Tax=uncultured archaeon MedDCM-OCT-S09-C50 TaxID=743102 RepID=D6PC76_9ARCH|nr:hypothetical protein [uncultured archaeon MedDCM-OCT-S09-C50]
MGGKGADMLFAELGGFCHQCPPFFDAEFVQSLDSTVVNRHGTPMQGLGGSFLESIAAQGWFLTKFNAFNASINALIDR